MTDSSKEQEDPGSVILLKPEACMPNPKSLTTGELPSVSLCCQLRFHTRKWSTYHDYHRPNLAPELGSFVHDQCARERHQLSSLEANHLRGGKDLHEWLLQAGRPARMLPFDAERETSKYDQVSLRISMKRLGSDCIPPYS